MIRHFGLAILGTALSLCPALGQTGQTEPVDIFPRAIQRLETIAPKPGDLESRTVPVQGQDFTEALEAKTLQDSVWPHHIQYQAPLPVTINAGDVVLAEFSIRTIASKAESGEAKTQFVLEQKGGEYKKSVAYDASAGPEWRKFQVPFQIKKTGTGAYKPGEAQICFRLGYRSQTIQIGGIRVVNYGPDYDIAKLPRTRLDYAGRDPKAEWRVQALDRINTLRKAPLVVQVTDSAGKPLQGAKVDVRMTKHAFAFGAATDLKYFGEQTPDGERYRQFVYDNLNQITPECDLKWNWWEWKERERAIVLQSLKTLYEKGIRVHGHCLIWPGLTSLPEDIKGILNDREALDKRITGHFTAMLEKTRGLVQEWDVVNEPYSNRDIMNRHGDQMVGEWYTQVHKIDPKPVLYLNDYPNFMNRGDNTAHKDDFERRLQEMLAAKVPVQGIGMQAHFGAVLCPPETALKELDRFAKLGLPIQITEFDVDIMDEETRSDFTRDFMIACFSHPAVTGFSTWGFWSGRHYKPSLALTYDNWSLTPSGQAWMDLVKKQWWTTAAGSSDAQGRYTVDGFLGDYEVKVKQGDKEVVTKFTLTKGAGPIQIRF